MYQPQFLVCTHCKKIVSVVKDSVVPVICCGEKMNALSPNTVEASTEKHIPDVKVAGNRIDVTIGSVIHPMLEEHYIEWIYLETSAGGQLHYLTPGAEPKASFIVSEGVTAVNVYAYCNIHGLWKTTVA